MKRFRATFHGNDSGFNPKSELQCKNRSYRPKGRATAADPQYPNRIAHKRCPNGVWAILKKPPLKAYLGIHLTHPETFICFACGLFLWGWYGLLDNCQIILGFGPRTYCAPNCLHLPVFCPMGIVCRMYKVSGKCQGPLNSICASWVFLVSLSVCNRLVSPRPTCRVDMFLRYICERPWSCCLIFGSHWQSLPGVSEWRARMSQLAPIVMVPNHKPLITLAAFFAHPPKSDFSPHQETKMRAQKNTKNPKATKPFEFTNSQTLQK